MIEFVCGTLYIWLNTKEIVNHIVSKWSENQVGLNMWWVIFSESKFKVNFLSIKEQSVKIAKLSNLNNCPFWIYDF